MLNLIPEQYRLLAKLIVVVVFLAGIFFTGMRVENWRMEAKFAQQEKDRIEALEKAHKEALTVLNTRLDEAKDRELQLSAALDKVDVDYNKLTDAVTRLKPRLVMESRDATGTTFKLSPAFRLCYNAAVTGRGRDIEACNTFDMPRPVPAS